MVTTVFMEEFGYRLADAPLPPSLPSSACGGDGVASHRDRGVSPSVQPSEARKGSTFPAAPSLGQELPSPRPLLGKMARKSQRSGSFAALFSALLPTHVTWAAGAPARPPRSDGGAAGAAAGGGRREVEGEWERRAAMPGRAREARAPAMLRG